ncbi:hypothetical protein JHK86_050444 [Glycine max]|nr:hypothetical protein JHK86_050444 [Glycine max]
MRDSAPTSNVIEPLNAAREVVGDVDSIKWREFYNGRLAIGGEQAKVVQGDLCTNYSHFESLA